jgi:hypothetical protein
VVRFTAAFLVTPIFIARSFPSSLPEWVRVVIHPNAQWPGYRPAGEAVASFNAIIFLYFLNKGIRFFSKRVQFKIDVNEKKNRSDHADNKRNQPHGLSPAPRVKNKPYIDGFIVFETVVFKYTMC